MQMWIVYLIDWYVKHEHIETIDLNRISALNILSFLKQNYIIKPDYGILLLIA